jgi:hypothetical protein
MYIYISSLNLPLLHLDLYKYDTLSIPWSRYTDAPFVKLELNGKEVVAPIAPPEFGNAQFSIPYAPGYANTFCFEPFIYINDHFTKTGSGQT